MDINTYISFFKYNLYEYIIRKGRFITKTIYDIFLYIDIAKAQNPG